MNFFKLITNNVIRSSRIYGGYFLSSSFSVFVFFLFSILNFHPQLKSGLGGSNGNIATLAAMGMTVSQVLIVALSFIFLWYSFGIFSKARKRELSIYVMLGIQPKDLRKLLFGENMVIGIGAIFSGITIGLVFMKAILIIVQNILSLTTGLDFYFPTVGIVLTIGVYIILFLLVSFFLTLKIETANLTQLGKSEEMPDKTPRANPVLVLLAFISLAIGYGSLVYFVQSIYNNHLLILLACVVFTVIATFLFFHQVSVYYYLWRKKRADYWQGKQLLLTATGIYRGKENANLFALITCTAAVALVGVSVTASLGSVEANTRNSLPSALVINHSFDPTQISEAEHPILQLGQEIFEQLATAGYEPTYEKIQPIPFEYNLKEENVSNYTGVISISDYNRLAKQLGMQTLVTKENELLLPAFDLEEATYFKEFGQSYPISIVDLEGDFTLTEVPIPFRLSVYKQTLIAPDSLVGLIKGRMQTEDMPYSEIYQFIHYQNWDDGSALNKQILTRLNQKVVDFETAMEEYYSIDDEETSIEKWDDIINTKYLEFDSLYKSIIQKRQSNGFILMIGLLIGGVFFLFASSILYFRLFGDLDKEGRLQRSLYQIGLTPKMRHQIVTRQLLTMYFLPMIVAACHSAVAFWGIVQLAEVNLWHYFFIIIAVYFLLQFLLFWISRWRYLTHLDLRAENPHVF